MKSPLAAMLSVLMLGGVVTGLATLMKDPDAQSSRPAATIQASAPECGSRSSAFVMSQTFVERQLKAPSTADFPWISSDGVRVTNEGGCRWSVVAYVDAQNGFGATIRTRYIVTLSKDPASDNWTASSVILE